jgi:Domain of unknown function (DUF4915)
MSEGNFVRGTRLPRMAEQRAWQEALAGRRLLVSGFGKWGGGVYDLTSGAPVALDDLPTSGLALGGGRIWRVLRAPGEQTATCELFSYDERGARSYQRLDAIRDPHDVCWHDGAVHITSSWDAAIWRLDVGSATEADPQVTWRGGSVPDAWHPNSLVVVDGRLHVCAFGRFDEHKAWKTAPDKRTGFVHDVERGVDVLGGLSHPHCPRLVGDRWYVCESTRGSLVELDLGGQELRRVAIRRFSRGLGLVERWAFLGGNARRSDDDSRAEIFVVDLESFEVVEVVTMPCLEVYDIVAVPFALARGLALGFGSNPARSVEQHRSDGRVEDRRPTPDNVRVQLVTPRVAPSCPRWSAPTRCRSWWCGSTTSRRCRWPRWSPTRSGSGPGGSLSTAGPRATGPHPTPSSRALWPRSRTCCTRARAPTSSWC